MRRVLIALGICALILLASDSPPEARASYPYDTWYYLWHPTGTTGTPQINSKLECGWHWDCDGNYNDGDKSGLDWHSTSEAYKTVWVRSSVYLPGGPSTSTRIAYMQTFNVTGACPKLLSDLRRTIDGELFGTVRQPHALGPSGGHYANIYGSSNTVMNASVLGTMVDHNNDGCSGYWHVHQWYQSGPGSLDYFYTKNSALPNESTCDHWAGNCGTVYYPWQFPYEYVVKWWGY